MLMQIQNLGFVAFVCMTETLLGFDQKIKPLILEPTPVASISNEQDGCRLLVSFLFVYN